MSEPQDEKKKTPRVNPVTTHDAQIVHSAKDMYPPFAVLF